ncbi:MAG: flavodoxin family protein [Acutalibacteraceae bacterium]
MKVILVNGSPRAKGCTYTALCEVARALNEENIETEIYQLGSKPINDCLGCRRCIELGKCIFDDCVNEFVKKADEADGFVFGSPVYYAHTSGQLLSFLDRCFYSGSSHFRYKPAAAVSSSRRAGGVTTMDVTNKYFSISQMPIVSATYWNEVHGRTPDDVRQDAEGMMTMYHLGKNMAWLLRCIEAGKKAGVEEPKNKKVLTDFIR